MWRPPDPLPVFSNSCIGCWACLNKCPRSAIRSSSASSENFYRGLEDKAVKLKKLGLG
ncbi:MAG: 4Fe-4S binding protein [Actinomycetota bacterium]